MGRIRLMTHGREMIVKLGRGGGETAAVCSGKAPLGKVRRIGAVEENAIN